MGRAARFHADYAWADLCDERTKLRSRKLKTHRWRAFIRQRVDLEVILGEIDANSNEVLHRRTPGWVAPATNGTTCRRGEAVHIINVGFRLASTLIVRMTMFTDFARFPESASRAVHVERAFKWFGRRQYNRRRHGGRPVVRDGEMARWRDGAMARWQEPGRRRG